MKQDKIQEALNKGQSDLGDTQKSNRPKQDLALALRIVRERAGLTLGEVAQLSGLKQICVLKLEMHTGSMPNTKEISLYAAACGTVPVIRFHFMVGTHETQKGTNLDNWKFMEIASAEI